MAILKLVRHLKSSGAPHRVPEQPLNCIILTLTLSYHDNSPELISNKRDNSNAANNVPVLKHTTNLSEM